MAPSGDQILNECKWPDLVTKYRTNSSSANEILKDLLTIWSQYPGSVVPLAMFYLPLSYDAYKGPKYFDTFTSGQCNLSSLVVDVVSWV